MILNLNISSTEQKIVWAFIVIEVVLVTLLIIGSYLSKAWFMINNVREQKKAAKIRAYFENRDIKTPPPYPENSGLIFSELSKTSMITEQEKRDFVKYHMIKRTRRFINSKSFIKRYYLLESFDYYITMKDKPILIQLIKDTRHIIGSKASRLANVLIDKSIYQAIIEKISELDVSIQKLYIAQLVKNDTLLRVIENNLNNTDVKALRKLYYDIAYHCGSDQALYNLALIDVDHSDGECQLAAIRVMALSDPEQAKNKLFTLLKSNDWLIRNSVLQSLMQIKIPESIDELAKCLNDENYWVRINSTKALLNSGDEGRRLLTDYQASNEARFKTVAAYFLDIQKIKEKL